MRSEREARGALRLRASRALQAKHHSKAGEASARSTIQHAQVVQIPINAIKAREASSFRGDKELSWERRAFREKDRHSHCEASARRLESAKRAAWGICSEAGGGVDPAFSHCEKARERSLRVIVERKASHAFERFRDRKRAMGDRAPI
jgi:hypothetical protein